MAEALTSLKLLDYSDKELIGIVTDVADNEGWAATEDIAKQLGLQNDRPNQCVGTRLAWLKRYGVVEGEKKKWRVTDVGAVVLNGELPQSANKMLDKMGPGQLFNVTRFLAGRQREVEVPVGHLLRREWRHGTGA